MADNQTVYKDGIFLEYVHTVRFLEA